MGGHRHGSGLPHRHRRIRGAGRSACGRLRQAPPRPRRPSMTSWMTWLAAVSTLLLFVYLVYALLRAEALE
ncbi:potassium-transporting ATPase subunit F [Paraburkholderia sp. 31.1]|nr:potassium-transporting ATPase subunit F [Paraburkholderia sp. 31.1]